MRFFEGDTAVNVIRIAALSVLLAASVAGAQSKKEQLQQQKQQQKQQAKAAAATAAATEKPKTCADQCDMMEKFCSDPCKKGAAENKQAQKSCEASCQQVVDLCNGSCKEKGRVDKQYMLERLKPPGGAKFTKEGDPATGGEGATNAH
jgi:hypothetical protein